MKIAVVGMGYVGITSAVCLARDGHEIVGIEVNDIKLASLSAGECPIYEPGVPELLREHVQSGRIRIAATIDAELPDCDIVIVCVGTPSAPDGSHNMGHIASASRDIANAAARDTGRERPLTVMYRSTMRPGSIETIVMPAFAAAFGDRPVDIDLVYNPEFLRESTAIADYDAPPKIVVGTIGGLPNALVTELYARIEAPVFNVRFRVAEITKFVDNTFHALKVAFANELGRVCAAENISARDMHQIFVSDTKLNISPAYLRPGGPFGGSCLPKDLRALDHIARSAGQDTPVIAALMASNAAHKQFIFDRCCQDLAPGSRILLNGLSFKNDSDDLRESPHVDLARRLIAAGYQLTILEPLLDLDKLVGAAHHYLLSELANYAEIIVTDPAIAAAGSYDRILDARGNAATLTLGDAPVVPVSAIP